jgi:hypothetical protein
MAVAIAAIAALATPGSASTPGPTNRDQPLKDGCQRTTFLNLILVNSPEWVYVNRDPSIHFASGITHVPHPTPVDQPGTHDWFDFNANLAPFKPYRYLIAGSKSAETNNYSGKDADREEFGRLHYEWEEGSLPKFAWPADGDRTAIWGSWIWDCGHWTEGSKITGERSEFHPLNAISVTRRNPWRARAGESETDFYVSSSGTSAHATEQCALHGKALPDGTYGPTFFGCARDPRNFTQPLARSYTFTVPAPPRPRGATKLVLRSVSQAHHGKVSERVKRLATGFRVTIKPKTKSLAWGKSYFVRWRAKSPKVTKLKITVEKLLIKHADPDPTEKGGVDPAGEKLALYLELNSDWVLVDNWAPQLFKAKDNMLVPLNRTIPVTLQPGRHLNIFMMGRECDGPSGVTLLGHFVPRTKPCPFNPTESKISSHNNDDPGTILITYSSLHAALGKHTIKSRPTVNFPGTGPITFNDGVQGNDDYELTFKVTRAR